jgi:ketosteroid isomerase-like protein
MREGERLEGVIVTLPVTVRLGYSAAMSQENLEIMERLFAGWVEGDYSITLEILDPEVEYEFHWGVDHVSVKGVEALIQTFVDRLSHWAEYHSGEPEELIDAGDHVVAVYKILGRGKHSETPVEMLVAGAYTFRDGRIVRMVLTESRQQALEAVGLSERA